MWRGEDIFGWVGEKCEILVWSPAFSDTQEEEGNLGNLVTN